MNTNTLKPDPLAYYSPETRFFADLAQNFVETGQLNPESLYLILDWKAPRARKRHLQRLARCAGGSFDNAARDIGTALHNASEPQHRLKLLMSPEWGFRLPTASAILTVLYPDTFTVYDKRVCEVLGDFDQLANMNWSDELWREYGRYVDAVRAAAPSGSSLRDSDRRLWGTDKRQVMREELAGLGQSVISE